MHEVSFEEALEQILAKDARYARDAYLFVREALDHTQKTVGKVKSGRMRHVTGQELLDGIREFALTQFGPMAMTVLEEWGIHACGDFGEIVFNMVEMGGPSRFSGGDIRDLRSFTAKLKERSEPVSQYLWDQLSKELREKLQADAEGKTVEPVLLKELNEILRTRALHEPQRFASVSLSDQTKSMMGVELKGAQLSRLNRLLLEDAFPLEIVKSQGLLAKTETDSRADFQRGYDFCEAFRKPFLPRSKQPMKAETTPARPSGIKLKKGQTPL